MDTSKLESSQIENLAALVKILADESLLHHEFVHHNPTLSQKIYDSYLANDLRANSINQNNILDHTVLNLNSRTLNSFSDVKVAKKQCSLSCFSRIIAWYGGVAYSQAC